MQKKIVWLLYLLVVTLAGMEGVLWLLGYRPYRNTDYTVYISPYPAFAADDSLGIQLVPGYFDITLNDALTFHATHQSNGRRQVWPVVSDTLPDILLMGCSFTYGYGVNDSLHFASLLQQELPSNRILDFGVPGYGTAQSCLQLESYLTHHTPQQVILVYSTVHGNRNALSPSFRKDLKIGFTRSDATNDSLLHAARFPYGDTNGNIMFEQWSDVYTDHPLRSKSALVNWVYTTAENMQQRKMKTLAISAALIHRMAEDCELAGVPFSVVCLDSNEETNAIQTLLAEEMFLWTDLHFSFEDDSMTNQPYDSHPNEKGHRYIADQILLSLQ